MSISQSLSGSDKMARSFLHIAKISPSTQQRFAHPEQKMCKKIPHHLRAPNFDLWPALSKICLTLFISRQEGKFSYLLFFNKFVFELHYIFKGKFDDTKCTYLSSLNSVLLYFTGFFFA